MAQSKTKKSGTTGKAKKAATKGDDASGESEVKATKGGVAKSAKATSGKGASAKVAKRPAATKASAKGGKRKSAAKDVEDDQFDGDGLDLDDDDGVDDAEAGEGKPAKAKRTHALVIVESPAKARTIKKYLGRGYTVKASVGHIKDLPKSKIGVDLEHDFAPEYVAIRGKTKVIAELKAAAKGATTVYLAPDPDREGEAIAWHIADEIKDGTGATIYRVLFNEITKKGITEALKVPTELNLAKYEAQQARRILDRLVGYKISPILWDKVKRGLSAGRVQSVAVRLVCEREEEIKAFRPEEYWTIECDLGADMPPIVLSKLIRVGDEKAEIAEGIRANALADALRGALFVVARVERKERRRFPQPPFITSKLQQEAARKLRFTAKKTMGLAQRLYEGMELGSEGPAGLITYMRTDSVRLSDDAVAEARGYIQETFGAEYLPEEAIQYKVAKQAQGAHEAIRPTSTKYDPQTVRRLMLESGKTAEDPREAEDLIALYTLVWNRFIACQMKPAVYDSTSCDIAATPQSGEHAGKQMTLRATGQVIKFPGYTAVYTETADEDAGVKRSKEQATDAQAENQDNDDRRLPPLTEGQSLKLLELRPEQHFTQPPPRFTEATLVKELEEKGIGRPSTFASILSTIQDRGYVEKREGRFFPTELGGLVNGLLVESFPKIVDVGFTANMEERLDKVEEGTDDWQGLLREFYTPFKTDLARAATEMRDVKREEIATELTCEKCNGPMVIKWGRNGQFLACKAYPECKNTKEFTRRPDGTVEIAKEKTTDEKCENCTAPMVFRRGRFGEFLACSRYPECKTTKPVPIGVNCPRPGCGGAIAQRRSKRGTPFYGCSNWSKTKCDFVVWDKPIPEPCPQCGALFVVKKESRRGARLRCVAEGCGWTRTEGEDPGMTLPPEATPPAITPPLVAGQG